jgi:hypothetical protein
VSEQDNVPRAQGRPGTYEVWFLTFTDRSSGTGYWIRSTVRTGTSGEGSAGVWFARFDRADPSRTLGINRVTDESKVAPEGFDVEIGGSVMHSGAASGALEGGGHRATWDLEYRTGDPTYRLLPDALYRGRLASTKPFSPNPDTRITGTITVDDEAVEIREAPAQQGHLFGSRHAERWAWAHCSDFIDAGAAVQALSAKGRLGPFTTPYVTFVGVRWEGRWIRLAKLGRRPDFELGTWRVDLESRQYRLTGRIEAPARDLIRARYQDPDGRPRFCHHTGVASCRLALFERRAGALEEVALLESRGSTHAEWAGRTPARTIEREFIEALA